MQYHEIMHEIGDWSTPLEFNNYLPSPEFAGFVKSYQLLTGQYKIRQKKPWYILPDNSAHLIFFLEEKKGQLRPSFRLIGPRTSHRLINRASRRLTLITSFQPGALWFFCQMPVAELTDQAVDAELFLKGIDEQLLQQMSQAAQNRDAESLIQLVEKLLKLNLRPSTAAFDFLDQFRRMQASPIIKVKEAANLMGISERYLRTLSLRYIGQSPKEYLQISRFTESLILSNEHREWPAIACDAGYYDQSHMIAAYQRMCGKSPEKLFEA